MHFDKFILQYMIDRIVKNNFCIQKNIYSKCFSRRICLPCNVTASITSSFTTTTSIVDCFGCFLRLIEAWVAFVISLCIKDSHLLCCFAASFASFRTCHWIAFAAQPSAAAFSLWTRSFLFSSFLVIVNCFFSSIFSCLKASFIFLIDWNSFTVCTLADE